MMNDTASPFTAPSQQVFGVPMYYSQPPQQPLVPQREADDNRRKTAKKEKKPSVPVHLPFCYGGRCAVYSVVLVFSLLCVIFAAVAVGNATYTTVEPTKQVTAVDPYYNTTYVKTLYVFITVRAWSGNAYDSYYCGTTYDTVDAALDSVDFGALTMYRYACVRTPRALYAVGGVSVVTLICSALLLVVSCVVLGVLSCQRRRARKAAGVGAVAMPVLQAQHQLQQAVASGAEVYVVSGSAAAPRFVICTKADAAHRARKMVEEAKARRVLGILCLAFSAVCVVMSIVGLATGLGAQSDITRAVERAQAKDSSVSITYDAAVSSASVWPAIPILVCSLVMTVLLAVPYLSGIADRASEAAPQDPTSMHAPTTPFGDEEAEMGTAARTCELVHTGYIDNVATVAHHHPCEHYDERAEKRV